MATQADNKSMAEQLLKEGADVVSKISMLHDSRKLIGDKLNGKEHLGNIERSKLGEAHEALTEVMDELGKKAMGIWAQAQVYATLATVPDNLPEAWTPVPRPHPSKALSPLEWMHAQAVSNFPNARVRIRKIYDQDNDEIYEIRVEEGGKVTHYSFIPDQNAADPYKLGPSETWRKYD